MKLGIILWRSKWRENGTVYVHWPYCSQLCTYCNFNKYIRSNVDHEQMTKCLATELTNLLKLSGVKTITSVYFGGGTPSLAEPRMVETILRTIGERATLVHNAEVTLEANPTSAQTNKLRSFKMAGITRLSIGVQSFVAEDLKLMNRDHSLSESKLLAIAAQNLFPGRFSIDIIFGRPRQTLSGWVTELKQVQDVGSQHISLYQLTVERSTPLAKAVNRNEVVLPTNDAVAEMYETSVEMLNDVGLRRYEISNFAASEESKSQHNLSYWRGSNYIGIGPGAHSRFVCDDQFIQSINTLEPNHWMNKVTTNGNGLQKVRKMKNCERLDEVVATSMRTSEGLTNEIWEQFEPSRSLQDMFSDNSLISSGYILVDEHGMRATDRGLNVLDSLLPDLLQYCNVL